MATVYVNGKFLHQRMTGVQRFASELLVATDGLLMEQQVVPGRPWVLLHPPGVQPPPLRFIATRTVGPAMPSLHAWEQIALPWAARGGLLLNLSGSAPWWAAAQVCSFHDAAVFDVPSAYTPGFKAWYRALFAHAARTARRVLTVSEFSRGRLAAHLPLAREAIGLVPNAASHLASIREEPSVLQRLSLQPQRFVLAVASANRAKNLPLLCAAFRQLPQELGLELLIVGGRNRQVFSVGEDADEAAAADAGHPGIKHAGHVTDGELKALYAHAMLLAFPSSYEGFGLPPLEAMACGCPVVVSRAGALPEVCANAARYVEPGSEHSLAHEMEHLARHPQERDRLRQLGLQNAARFSWRHSAQCLLSEMAVAA